MNGLKARAIAAPWWGGVQFLLMNQSAVGVKVVFEEKSDLERSVSTEPTFQLEMTDAQTLMDDLWNCGLRPTEGAGTAGAMAATQKHLEDMRRMNDKLLAKVLEEKP